MSDGAIDSQIRVEITRTQTDAAKHATDVAYRVRNTGRHAVWLVSDPWYVWELRAETITVSFARGPMQAGVEVFGYFDPVVVRLDPGTDLERDLEIEWPLKLNTIWNLEDAVWPDAGRYQLRVEVGYGLTPGPVQDGDGSVEDRVLGWQLKASSTPRPLEVPPK